MSGQVPGWGNKNNEKSVAGWVEYSQNATLVFMSAYSVYVFLGIITIPLSTRLYQQRYLIWLREKDLNLRPSGYEPDELPTAPSRDILSTSSLVLNYYSTNRFDCQAFIRKSFLLFSTFFFYKTASQLFIKSYALKYFSSRGIHFSA